MRGDTGFAVRLASHLRLTLREVFDMPAAEFAVWLCYYCENGFDIDRTEFVIAKAGSATAAAGGLSIRPADLVMPTAAPDPAEKRKRLFAWLDSIAKGNPRGGK